MAHSTAPLQAFLNSASAIPQRELSLRDMDLAARLRLMAQLMREEESPELVQIFIEAQMADEAELKEEAHDAEWKLVEAQKANEALSHQLHGTQIDRDIAEKKLDAYKLRDADHLKFREKAEIIIADQEEEATTDPLTGLYNVKAYHAEGERRLKSARNSEICVSMILADLKKFKSINDVHGHNAGDKAICEAGSAIQKTIRDTDFVARIGGDEYIILLSDTDKDGAVKVLEKLREKFSDLSFAWNNQTIRIQGNFGIAHLKKGQSLIDLKEFADADMYKGKKADPDYAPRP